MTNIIEYLWTLIFSGIHTLLYAWIIHLVLMFMLYSW